MEEGDGRIISSKNRYVNGKILIRLSVLQMAIEMAIPTIPVMMKIIMNMMIIHNNNSNKNR